MFPLTVLNFYFEQSLQVETLSLSLVHLLLIFFILFLSAFPSSHLISLGWYIVIGKVGHAFLTFPLVAIMSSSEISFIIIYWFFSGL